MWWNSRCILWQQPGSELDKHHRQLHDMRFIQVFAQKTIRHCERYWSPTCCVHRVLHEAAMMRVHMHSSKQAHISEQISARKGIGMFTPKKFRDSCMSLVLGGGGTCGNSFSGSVQMEGNPPPSFCPSPVLTGGMLGLEEVAHTCVVAQLCQLYRVSKQTVIRTVIWGSTVWGTVCSFGDAVM